MTAKPGRLSAASLGTRDPKRNLWKVSRIEKEGKCDALHGRYCVETGSKASSWNTKRIRICTIPSKYRYWKTAALGPSSGAKCCPMYPTPRSTLRRPPSATSYEVSFIWRFYKPKPLRTLKKIETDIRAPGKETEGFLDDLLVGGD